MLCDIPNEWREGIVNALCLTFQADVITCDAIRDCQTLTTFSAFTLQGTTVTVKYTNEKGSVQTSDFELTVPIQEVGADLDGDCIIFEENFLLSDKIQAIIDAYCLCCPAPTTTSTTTTTTICHDYYYANQFTCELSVCTPGDINLLVAMPCGFINTPGMYYPNEEDSSDLYQIVSTATFGEPSVHLDPSGNMSCTSFCPTSTTTTTSSSTTTTTTCCPITDADIVEITTTTTTTTTIAP